MKKAYLVIFASMIAAALQGQSIQRAVINSTGGNIGAPGSVQMTLSVGETFIGVSETREFGLAQGFLGGSKTIVAAPAAVEDIVAESAAVYPNPFSGTVRIKTDVSDLQVSVYNIMGQEVYSGIYQNEGINLSHLYPGIYIIQAVSNNKIVSTTKLLKQ